MKNNKTEIATAEPNLFPIQEKILNLVFYGDRISSDDRLILLHEFDFSEKTGGLIVKLNNYLFYAGDEFQIIRSTK